MSKPLIQIDDLLRKMTEQEHAQYLAAIANLSQLPQVKDETPIAN